MYRRGEPSNHVGAWVWPHLAAATVTPEGCRLHQATNTCAHRPRVRRASRQRAVSFTEDATGCCIRVQPTTRCGMVRLHYLAYRDAWPSCSSASRRTACHLSCSPLQHPTPCNSPVHYGTCVSAGMFLYAMPGTHVYTKSIPRGNPNPGGWFGSILQGCNEGCNEGEDLRQPLSVQRKYWRGHDGVALCRTGPVREQL